MLFSMMLGSPLLDFVYDGLQNSKLVDGKLPQSLQFSIHGNGDADFANMDLEHADPSKILPMAGQISRDLVPHDLRRPPLPPVRIAGVN